MIAKDGQPAEPGSLDSYEAAVLDFLDKEMADVQSTMNENRQSEELDALVADLLQQVMTESDQPQVSGEMLTSPEDMKDILAEFMPQEEADSPPQRTHAPAELTYELEPVQPASIAANDESSVQEAVAPTGPEISAEPAPQAKASPAPLAAVFASQIARKNRMPVLAAAVVCALAIIGIAIYYFSRSSETAPVSETAQTVAPAAMEPEPAVTPVPASAQPATNSKAARAVPPAVNKKLESAASKAPAPVAVPQKPSVSKQTPSASQVTPPPAAPAANIPSPPPAKEEKPAETQVAQSQPPVVPRAVPEKQAPPAAAENPAPVSAAPEKQPAPQPPIALASMNNASPAPQPPAPVPASSAAPAVAPLVARKLVPAVAISQVSPKFPEIAMRTRMSANVVVELDIDKQGKVVKATPVSGPDIFYKEAINAAMQWRYKPATVGGTNVSSQVKVTFDFKLKK